MKNKKNKSDKSKTKSIRSQLTQYSSESEESEEGSDDDVQKKAKSEITTKEVTVLSKHQNSSQMTTSAVTKTVTIILIAKRMIILIVNLYTNLVKIIIQVKIIKMLKYKRPVRLHVYRISQVIIIWQLKTKMHRKRRKQVIKIIWQVTRSKRRKRRKTVMV